ncbi:hypothetical protein GCK72_020592 [Caenorhabditis remanei]|uniref:Peptidase M13 C-terminal domain-containing protein n=1 Tax=Caenorhabditis remanei TaxID=31234 RepID=A0A6A5GGY6_CAERE|nr:hypothetical protein GCK72_020592 [Caenorhabditis remanei]KAF1754034.1 hypothetical protein GCK72_020592 [Caenorhabditis remanei]
MPGKKPPSSLTTGLSCLIIVVMALITAFILMMTGRDNPIVLVPAKPWKSETPVTSRPPIKASTTQKVPTSATKTEETTRKPRNVCESPECIALAHQLHNWKNPSVDPCEDFYEYSCGKFNEHSLPSSSRLERKDKLMNSMLNKFLAKNETSNSISENSMKLFYRKCKDYYNPKTYRKLVIEKWREVISIFREIGSWPYLDENWDDSELDLNDAFTGLANYGFPFLTFFFLNSAENYTVSVATISMEKVEKLTVTDFKAVLTLSGIVPDEQLLEDDLKLVDELEKDISNLSSEADGEASLSDLQAAVPSIDFERIIRHFINSSKDDETWSKVKENVMVSKIPLFFNQTKNLETILKSTPKRTIANYIMFNFVRILNMHKNTDCLKEVLNDFSFPALRVLVQHYFDRENLQIASELVDNIKGHLINTFENSTWLHPETKKNAIRKVEMMKKIIGYPEEYDAPGALDKMYESLNFSTSDSYFQLDLKNFKFNTQLTLKLTPMASLLIMRESKNLAANAFHLRSRNWLGINIALLDDPFFDSTYPKYAQIAGVGAIIGHEIGHGFDPNGRKRDENGKENDWWTPEDSAEYDRRAQCLIDQYDEFDDPDFGKNLNGSITIGEIVADLIGVDVAWKTYKSLDMSAEPSIIGFENYSLDKLFYQLKALNWCGTGAEYDLEDQLKFVHPTESFRINGIFSNMKSFAETFNCPVGSPMNPEKKCELF